MKFRSFIGFAFIIIIVDSPHYPIRLCLTLHTCSSSRLFKWIANANANENR